MAQFWSFGSSASQIIHLYAKQQVTVGSAALKWNRVWTNAFATKKGLPALNLDFYQTHYYQWMDCCSTNNDPDLGTTTWSPLTQNVSALGLDTPDRGGRDPHADGQRCLPARQGTGQRLRRVLGLELPLSEHRRPHAGRLGGLHAVGIGACGHCPHRAASDHGADGRGAEDADDTAIAHSPGDQHADKAGGADGYRDEARRAADGNGHQAFGGHRDPTRRKYADEDEHRACSDQHDRCHGDAHLCAAAANGDAHDGSNADENGRSRLDAGGGGVRPHDGRWLQ